jgi:hypothetical protein
MNALAQRGRVGLIPALMLQHEDDTVRLRALALFGASKREDWLRRAAELLHHERELVRMAAARALAAHGRLDESKLAADASPSLRGYAVLQRALRDEKRSPLDAPEIAGILARQGVVGDEERLGLLSAIGDAPLKPVLLPLLGALGKLRHTTRRWSVELARAATSQRDARLIPGLIARLAAREGREAIRAALSAFGEPAVDELRRTLHDPEIARGVRVHIPNTLARIGTARSAEILLRTIETDFDGLVRYKAIRALGRMMVAGATKVDRSRVEALALDNLVEHYRLLGLRVRFDATPLAATSGLHRHEPTERVLLGLLNDKLRQSLERVFRLLKIAHFDENIHRAHAAYLSDDPQARANAAELFDTLLRRRDEGKLRELLRILGEEATPLEALESARGVLGYDPPRTAGDALDIIAEDQDKTLASLARYHRDARAALSRGAASVSRERPLETIRARELEDRGVIYA